MQPDYQPAASWVHYTTSCNTQSSAPEDGRNYRPKHVELIGIINKPLLLYLVGCLYYYYYYYYSTQGYNLGLILKDSLDRKLIHNGRAKSDH